MYIIRKEFHFCASHELLGLPTSHPCSRVHGHNYVVVVELRSIKLNDVGFVVDYRNLDEIKKFIDNTYDHRHLNDILQYNPTAENMAKNFFKIFKTMQPYLYAVEVWETPKTCARYEQS